MVDPFAAQISKWQAQWPPDVSADDLFPTDKSIVIYGAGHFGQQAHGVLSRHGLKVEAFVDRRGGEVKTIGDLPCYSPDDSRANDLFRTGSVVVLGVFNFAVSIHQLMKDLKKRGAQKLVTPLDLYEAFPQDLSSHFWLAPRSFYRERMDEAHKVNELWADDESRDCYLRILRLRIDHDWNALDSPDRADQYFPASLPRWREPLEMVDGGAFTGDTIKVLLQEGYQFKRVLAFEPDILNREKLADCVKRELAGIEVSISACGLGSATGSGSFSGGLGEGSHFTGEAGYVPVVALDNVVGDDPINLIKLDIEGAEMDALLGMKRTVERWRPDLAVCLYHNPCHLFSIVELLNEWQVGCQFYLRQHQFCGFETVLYARH
jgi:FkbM family methyltransferase